METKEHKEIKTIINKKLAEWFKASIQEYEVNGHRADVYAITEDGIIIDVEIIWSKGTIRDDINLLHEVEADVKIIIVEPSILDTKTKRLLDKFIIDQTKKLIIVSKPINGTEILTDPVFLDNTFKDTIMELISKAQIRKPSKLKVLPDMGKIIWRVRYPHRLPLVTAPIKFPIEITIRNETEKTMLCKLMLQSGNSCLYFKPLKPIERIRKRRLGFQKEVVKLWATLTDLRESMLAPQEWKTMTFHAVYISERFDLALAKQLELRYWFLIDGNSGEPIGPIGPYTEYITLYYPSYDNEYV